MSRVSARRAALAVAFVLASVDAFAAVSAAAPAKVHPGPVPEARCGPGSHPETGMQGRIPPSDVASRRAESGYDCNVSLVGVAKTGNAGWKVARYGDCAYFNGDPGGVPLGLLLAEAPGTYAVDVSDPARPVVTDVMRTVAMSSPHESMALDSKRGLLMATWSSAATAPGVLEIYDVKTDCRHPRLVSTLPSSLLGHEGNLSPDGLTYYSGSWEGQTLVAVDVSNPLAPVPVAFEHIKAHGMSASRDGTRLYLTVGGLEEGLVILDTTSIQKRESGASFEVIGRVGWPEKSTPQFALPITVKGRKYVLETDEFGGKAHTGTRPVGAARIIDISNEKAPVVVSNLRLEVHMPEAQPVFATEGDPVPAYGGPYSTHYCSVPREVDPGIVACSMLRSGLRIFDIRDVRRPREVAYYNPPAPQELAGTSGGSAQLHVGSNVEFVPERNEIWLGVQDSGLHVIRLTNGVWRSRGTGRPAAPRPRVAGLGGAPVLPSPGSLPATGLPLGTGTAAAVTLLLGSVLRTHRSRRLG